MFLRFIPNQQLGENVIVNGDFATDSNWNKGTGWTISNGSANGLNATGDLQQASVIESGKYYEVTFTISNYVEGSVRVELPSNSAAGITRSANGTYTERILSVGTIVQFDGRTSFTGSIDNVSVKEVDQFSLDETTNNNNAKLLTGTSLDFDGAGNYVDIDAFTMSGTIATFAFWINPDAVGNNMYIFDSDGGGYRAIIGFRDPDSTGVINLSLYTGSWREFGTISLNTWQRVVITASGTTGKCYVNGVQLGVDKTITAIGLSGITSAAIGSGHTAIGSFLNGQLSDFQIWNSAWSATDVANDYASPNELVSSVSVSNLKAWWAFTEGSGSFAFDNATAPGSELVTDGNFPNGDNWTNENGWTFPSNTAAYSSGANNSKLLQDIGITSGKTYRLTFDYTRSAGSFTVREYDGSFVVLGTFSDASDSIELFFNSASNNGTLYITAVGTTFVGSITNVSVKEISARTILGATYVDSQSSILQLGMINWSNGSNVFLPPSPTNSAQDILGNAVRDRLNSINLTGTGYAEVADDASINPTSEITIQCWIKSNTETSKGLVAKWHSGSDSKDYMLFKNQTNNFRFYIGATQLTSGTISTTGWINIAGTYDGSNMKTFINGALSTTNSTTGSIPNNTRVLEIGRYASASSASYSERIDDVKIYDRALSADEILQNYKAGTSAHTN